ncbi:MAG: hypothetical protein FJ108_14515 [Deltaproteobacteria bacterium]|nr:hypothetical protein [Deltaproteobacteria bacterium]
MEVVRPPSGRLPDTEERDLPAPVPFRRMLGPGVILAGLSIGSGELVLWPRLTAEHGFALFWGAWIGVTLQYFMNMEIERYTLATGESAVTGFVRLARPLGPIFLVCGTVPWIWPGWATGAGELLAWQIGGSPTAYAIAGLIACGVLLTLGPVVYRTVEAVQTVLVLGIFALLLVLAVLLIRAADVGALLGGALQIGRIPDGVELPLFLGALAFAGAGGSVNLAQSNYIRDKGYGMGAYIGRITSPFSGREEAQSEIGLRFAGSAENLARWRVWWRRANLEHLVTFQLLCVGSLALFCLLTHTLLAPDAPLSPDFGFLRDQADALRLRFGGAARLAFLWASIFVLLSTEFALLDAVSRVVADLARVSFLRDSARFTIGRLYFLFLWAFIAFGVAVLGLGLSSPLTLLVLSASLNAGVMFLYSGLLIWLNLRTFRGALRPSWPRIAMLAGAFAFYGYFSALTIVSQLARLFA